MANQFSDDIRQRVVAYMDAVEASAGTAGEFVKEQTPLIAQEFLAWTFYESFLWAVIGGVAALAVIATGLIATNWVWRGERDDVLKNGHPPFAVLPLFAAVVMGGCLAGLCLKHVSIAIKVSVAPRVVLLEKVAEMIP